MKPLIIQIEYGTTKDMLAMISASRAISAGNSSGYNYASGRLDHQTYFKSIRVEQEHLACVVLDREGDPVKIGRLQRYVADVKSDINREMQLEELKKMAA